MPAPIDALGLPPLAELLPAELRRALDLAPAAQYGLACRDVARAAVELEVLGAAPFVGARIPAPGWVERGERRRCHLDFALSQNGDVQIELLGPGSGTDFYSAVGTGDRPVLHHLGVYQRGIEAITTRLEAAGYPAVVSGGVHLGALASFRFRYFDTRETLGLYLEILDFRGPGGRSLEVAPWVRRLSAVKSALGASHTNRP